MGFFDQLKNLTAGQRGPLLSSLATGHPITAGSLAAAGEYLEDDKSDKFHRAAAMAGGAALANATTAPVARLVADAVLSSTGLSGNAGKIVHAVISDVIPATAQYQVAKGIKDYMSSDTCMCKDGKYNPKCPVCSKSQKYLDSHHKLNPEAKVAFNISPALKNFAVDTAKKGVIPGLAAAGLDYATSNDPNKSVMGSLGKGAVVGAGVGAARAGHAAGMAGQGPAAQAYQGAVGTVQNAAGQLGQHAQTIGQSAMQGIQNMMPAQEGSKTGAYLLAYEKEAAHAAGVNDAVDAFIPKTAGTVGKAIGTGLQTVAKGLGASTTGVGNAAGAVIGAIGGGIEGADQGLKGVLAHGAKGAISGALPAGAGFLADAAATPLINKALAPAPGAPPAPGMPH